MTILEIVAFARKIRDTVADGLKHAAHYLRALGFSLAFASWALLGA